MVECAACQEWVLCRSMCLTCTIKEKQELYCYLCRPPPCSQKYCPLGHKLKMRKKPGKSRFCDLCDAPASLMSSQEVYGFCPCDFDLCQACHGKVPENDPRIPVKWNARKMWPLSLVNDDDSGDSDWKESEEVMRSYGRAVRDHGPLRNPGQAVINPEELRVEGQEEPINQRVMRSHEDESR